MNGFDQSNYQNSFTRPIVLEIHELNAPQNVSQRSLRALLSFIVCLVVFYYFFWTSIDLRSQYYLYFTNETTHAHVSLFVYDLLSLEMNELNINYTKYKQIEHRQTELNCNSTTNMLILTDLPGGFGHQIFLLSLFMQLAALQNKSFLFSTTHWSFATDKNYKGISYYFEPLTNCIINNQIQTTDHMHNDITTTQNLKQESKVYGLSMDWNGYEDAYIAYIMRLNNKTKNIIMHSLKSNLYIYNNNNTHFNPHNSISIQI
eukprot:314974_1